MSFNVEKRKRYAIKEFEYIIKTYILPLFDVKGELTTKNRKIRCNSLISFSEKDDVFLATFCPCIGIAPFYCTIKVYSNPALKKRAITILKELLKVTEYSYIDFSKRRDYGKTISAKSSYKTRTFDLAFELGICKWLTPREVDATILHKVITHMINWASRTYEGKNVPFGIVINYQEETNSCAANYLHFLENDSSAVFTDGVFSGILLDRKGRVLSFLTRDSEPPKPKEKYECIFAPYQFTDIAKHCVNSNIGIIAMTNGEIILIKNKEVCFAKRGLKWVTFDWMRVYLNLKPYFFYDEKSKEEEIKSKIRELYCTLLDVSFAHTGGCISIIVPNQKEGIEELIKERIDLYTINSLPQGISKESIQKIEMLTYLLTYPKNKIRSFFEIERIMRKEIVGLDGATVVSLNGSFYCAGSIVEVPSGSSGGGRTAAAKKLAQYGVGIKISEDGYIEAYGLCNAIEDKMKPSNNDYGITPLFTFK